jgi:hypothetical protein
MTTCSLQAPDLVVRAAAISAQRPIVGVFGSEILEPEFEVLCAKRASREGKNFLKSALDTWRRTADGAFATLCCQLTR